MELATSGVTVNGVSPVPTVTSCFRANNPSDGASQRRYLAGAPMQRLATPDEIAAAIALLLSEYAGFITGQTLHVDGGASIGRAPF